MRAVLFYFHEKKEQETKYQASALSFDTDQEKVPGMKQANVSARFLLMLLNTFQLRGNLAPVSLTPAR